MADNEPKPRDDRNLDQEPSLGQILRRAREAQGLGIEQIGTELRLERRVLDALEHDRLDDLGPPVFAKGYIRQYGQRLGLDAERLLARYNAAAGRQEVVIEPSRTIRLHDERHIATWAIAVVALLLVGVLLFVWWTSEAPGPVELPAGGSAEPGLPAVPEQTSGRDGSAGPSQGAGAASGPEQAAAASAGEPRPDPLDAPVPGPADAPERIDTSAGAGAAAGLGGPVAPPDPGVAPVADVARAVESVDNVAPEPIAGALRLELEFDEDSWADVADARGERLVYGLMRAGDSASVAGEPPVSVLLGNAAGVRLAVDGEPFAIPAASRRGDLAEFVVDAFEN